jgi:hypothetical protein
MEVFGILLLAGIAWLWLDSLKAREAAIRAAREVCVAEGLLLLDDTVAISGLKPAMKTGASSSSAHTISNSATPATIASRAASSCGAAGW